MQLENQQEVPDPTPEIVFQALSAVARGDPSHADAALRRWETDAAPGFLQFLLSIVERPEAQVSQVRQMARGHAIRDKGLRAGGTPSTVWTKERSYDRLPGRLRLERLSVRGCIGSARTQGQQKLSFRHLEIVRRGRCRLRR